MAYSTDLGNGVYLIDTSDILIAPEVNERFDKSVKEIFENATARYDITFTKTESPLEESSKKTTGSQRQRFQR
jgi:hypothetical protein